jgi:signal transduction histidine kinase
MTVDYRRVDVAAMLRRVTDQSSAAVTGRSMVFSINAPDSLLPDVDPDKFQRVLLNLLSNAFKFHAVGARSRRRPSAAGS